MDSLTGEASDRLWAHTLNEQGIYKVLKVTANRGPDKTPLVARFGGITLRSNKWAVINDTKTKPIWSKRSEVVKTTKLTDLECKGQANKPEWAKMMAARWRKTLVVGSSRHHNIHYGRYDGPAFLK